MTEAQWLACTDRVKMLAFLAGKASKRKLRLFACACCRRIEDLLQDKRSQTAILIAEQFADGLADSRHLQAAEDSALTASKKAADGYWEHDTDAGWQAWTAAAAAAWVAAEEGEWALETALAAADARAGQWRPRAVLKTERKAQCGLLRDIFGNPFRSVAIDPSWLSWAGGTVAKMAQAIYDDKRFTDLPMLADALLQAGSQNEGVLAHCRAQTEHVPGCWVVDALLAKA